MLSPFNNTSMGVLDNVENVETLDFMNNTRVLCVQMRENDFYNLDELDF